MSKRRSGVNPSAYLGVEPLTPPNSIIAFTSPTQFDNNFNIGDIWLVGQLNAHGTFDTIIEGWILSIVDDLATWTQFYPVSGTGAGIFPTNNGIATQSGNIINIFGSNHITTSGAGNTITIDTDGAIANNFVADVGVAIPVGNQLIVAGGDVVHTTATAHSLHLNLDNGADGQLLIGGGAVATWALPTSSGGTIAIAGGPNTLNLEVTSPGVASIYHTDSGNAVPAAGNINYLGSININTSGAGNTITVDLDNDVLINQSLTTGTTYTSGNTLTVLAGGINSTGTTTLNDLTAGVMQTDGSGVVSSTNGANGQVLIGGGTAPVWNNITSTGGTITITNGPNTINLETTGGSFGSGPAFLAYLSNNQAVGTLGSAQVLIEVFDQTNNFFPGNGAGSPAVFTAPSTGYYLFNFFGGFHASVGNAMIITMSIVTTARTYRAIQVLDVTSATPSNYLQLTTIADMTSGDTAQFTVSAAGTGVQYFPFNPALTPAYRGTWVSGAKIV